MLIDAVGILLTVLIVNPRYCFIVLLLCFAELTVTVLLSMILELNVTEVVAGGIFTTIAGSGSNNLFMILSPLFFLLFGLGLYGGKVPWLDLINPIAAFKRPLPVLMIKTALFRMIIVFCMSSK